MRKNTYKNLTKGINKMDIEKIKSENITHEEHMNNVLQDIEYQKMYLDAAIQEFITDGDYDLFFQSLEQVIKVRMSISEFSQKTGITRAALYVQRRTSTEAGYNREIIERIRLFFACCIAINNKAVLSY